MAVDTSNRNPDIGGQAFNVSDPNPPIAFGDVYNVLTTLTVTTKFRDLPVVLMLALAHIIEAYYVLRLIHPTISWIFPQIKVLTLSRHCCFLTRFIMQGEMALLQPSLFSLTQIHLIFDDSRARKSPKEGGLGFKAPYTSMDGLCKLVIEWKNEGKREEETRVAGERFDFSFGFGTGDRKN